MPRFRGTAVAVAACAAALASGAAAASGDGVWVNGVVYDLAVTGPAPAGATATPLYVIAPVSAADPLHPLADARAHGFGAHDHVIALAQPGATFTGTCDLTLVVPGRNAVIGKSVRVRRTLTPAGPKPLLYAARLGAVFAPLDTAARVASAKRRGLASLIDTHTLLACTVSPRTAG